jgi:predicted MPP superfamily phosphohydrolase
VVAHTHGGQMRVPFTPDWSWTRLITSERVPADGWAEGYGARGNQLYVNRGIGFSLIPVRVNCRPELTVFTLRGDSAATGKEGP